jgi:uracil-DNA glycosylase
MRRVESLIAEPQLLDCGQSPNPFSLIFFLHFSGLFKPSQSIMLPSGKRKSEPLSAPDSKKPKGGSITAFFGAPKPKPANTESGSIPAPRPSNFNKEKWVASLTPEQKELLQLEIDTLDESWLAHLKDEVVSTDFLNLKRFLKKEKEMNIKVFPPEEDVYSW